MSEISRSVLFGKLNRVLFTSLEQATTFCKLRSNPYVELVHWLHQLMQQQNSDLQSIIRYFALDEATLTKDIIAALDRLPRGASAISDLSEHIDSAVERAWVYGSLKFGVDKIRSAHWLIGMLKTFNLRNTLKAISPQFEQINADTLVDNFNAICGSSDEAQESERSPHLSPDHSHPTKQSTAESALRQYGQDLTDRARNGDIDPVSGRDEEIRQIIDILMRRRQNNPLLTGEAGVGKTAVIEGLALRIAAGEVPPPLQNVQLWLLDIGMLQAGAGIRGEFESRLRKVIDEVQSSPIPIILFIDEIHTLIGAGGQQGTGDAANLLKPALARGQLRTLGATTWSEYKKYIEKDPALTRRFQVVQIHEPDETKALLMLRSLVRTLENHHRVLLLDEAVDAAVRLSHRYIPARQLPDKAVALLDTACARVAISQHAEPPQLENCRHHIEALKIELDIVEREAKVGIGNPQRSGIILNELAILEEQRIELENRWQQERALTDNIIQLQAQLHGQSIHEQPLHEQQHDDINARHAELLALQQQLKTRQGENPLIFASVDSNVVSAVISDWTGIPLSRMVKDEIDAVLHLADTLNQRVIGQYHALELIAKRVRTSRAKLDDPNKPVGVFMLCGPSGVGKTETALALAETLYGGEQNLITINMSEFQEAHTVSTLKGAPPGYVGYGEGGVLTEAVRRRPYSVVLLDEIEKAHSDVHEIFFQVFDKGWMEDGEGRHIDFRNTIIILTSNVGADLVSSLYLQQNSTPDPEKLTTALRNPLLHVFPAALLGRLIVIPYYPLSDKVMASIVYLQLDRIKKRLLENHDIVATFDDALIAFIVERCTEIESGGRMVDAILTNSLLPQISQLLLSANANDQQYRQLQVSLKQGEFQFRFMD
ncbi:type VI secretion system ATPase TssH [Xenorhabdus sp. IM139775]|uniref:type VI secretion system ATPase TssH n=1 Tax=Xenorhabdus sp. IM139775 TaxID=3025876 RepID=UPI00235A32EE|nr:type VI secretion system ATPase TssH [Xenorhabdus sp. IM139775]MDC9592068.1 type VI secretion system ATPase TssH [Xenorhabdus sp. IM139775]